MTSAEWDFAVICGLVWVSALIWIIGDKLGTKLDVINHTLAQIEKRLSEIESASNITSKEDRKTGYKRGL